MRLLHEQTRDQRSLQVFDVRREPVGRNDVRIVEGLDEELLPTANSHQPSSLYSGPRPTNPKPHSDYQMGPLTRRR